MLNTPDPSTRGFAARLQSPIWVVSLALLVAALGAAVAIAIAGTPRSNTGTTFVAATIPAQTSTPVTDTTAVVPTPTPTEPATTAAQTTTAALTVESPPTDTTPVTTVSIPITTAPVATAPATTAAATTTTSAPTVSGWPAGTHGWTVVLGSYPAGSGSTAAEAVAARAHAAGLSNTGVLVSDDFSSLRAGYLVAFAGIYASSDAAANAVSAAQAAGFSSAYSREITPA